MILSIFVISSLANQNLNDFIYKYKNSNELTKVKMVNDYFNKYPYVDDTQNYGRFDYWSNRNELIKNGGDCEDFAIAKYKTLIDMGVNPNKLELKIVKFKKTYHMILVYDNNKIKYYLDNVEKELKTKRNDIKILFNVKKIEGDSLIEKIAKLQLEDYKSRNSVL